MMNDHMLTDHSAHVAKAGHEIKFNGQEQASVQALMRKFETSPFNTPSVRSAGRYFAGLLPPYSAAFNLFILPDFLLVLFSLWLDWQEQHHNDLAFPRKWSAAKQSWSVAIVIILLFLFSNTGNDLSRFVYQFF
jgi:hypothetical protein